MTPISDVSAPPSASTVLALLNTHGVGDGALLGGGIGLSAILATLAHFFAVISDGGFVLMLYGEHRNHEFGPAHAQLVGLAIGIVGAVILTGISGVAAYFSRPRSIS